MVLLREVKKRMWIHTVSSRPSSVMLVTQQLKHRSPSCLSLWSSALDGWSSALRRPVDSGERFPSLVTVGFIFPWGGGRAIEEPERRNMRERKTDIAERGMSCPPPGLPAHSSGMRHSLPWGVHGLWRDEWSWSFVSLHPAVVLFCFYDQRFSLHEILIRKRKINA